MGEEELYLQKVQNKLSDKIEEIDRKLMSGEKELEQIQDYFWDNYTEFDEYGYELYDNNTAINSKIKEKASYIKERYRYEKMQDSPYFGRVDFCYQGEEIPEKCYIGIGNLATSAADVPMVYDWRAPISSLFYDFELGAGFYEAPMGEVHGEITCKKQYKIKRGKLIYAIESDMNIDDDILKAELSTHADAKLKSIVTTIQKEQNAIIRDASHRILAVQGCAGSGKTSVALHRVAYLLYHNRNNLKASQILILSPNGIFTDYISRILPELGEENISEMSLDVYAYKSLLQIGEAEDRYDEIEKILSDNISTNPRTEEADYKQTKGYVEELDGFMLELESDLMDICDFSYHGRTMTANRISQLFYEKLWELPLFERMKQIAGYVIDEEETLKDKDMEEEEQQYIYEKMNRMYETTDLLTIYNRFLKSTGRETVSMRGGMIRYEDVYPLLYLKYSLWKGEEKKKVRHLIIDEMQDYSYLQYRIIRKMFDCQMTILGDKVQTMAEKQSDVLTFLPQIFGRDLYQMSLNKSYRSTRQITELAGRLSEEETVNCIFREGEEPGVIPSESKSIMFDKIAQRLRQTEEMETRAILCLHADMAEQVYEELVRRMPDTEISLLTKDSKKFSKGICVTTFYLAKGLEFDSVVVPHLEEYNSALHKQALYINVTRALHKLDFFYIEKKTEIPFLIYLSDKERS